jgi:hypothetical protein
LPPRRPNARASLASTAKLMLARLEAEALPLESAGACTPDEQERWRKIQMRRLELLIRACWGDAMGGDLSANEQARRLVADQMRVMGIEGKAAEAPATTELDEVAELMRLAGFEVRRIDDGTTTRATETIETSGTDAATEAEDLAGDGSNQ